MESQKKKAAPDPDDAQYKRYPKSKYATRKMITPAQRDALEADAEFRWVRELWHTAYKNNTQNRNTQSAGWDVMSIRDKVLKNAGLPTIS